MIQHSPVNGELNSIALCTYLTGNGKCSSLHDKLEIISIIYSFSCHENAAEQSKTRIDPSKSTLSVLRVFLIVESYCEESGRFLMPAEILSEFKGHY